MGALLVQDATGRTIYRTVPRVVGSRVLLQVPSSELRDAKYPLKLDPIISPEYAASDPVYRTAFDDQRYPEIAAGADAYLAVWQDDRRNGSIYGARINTSGVVVDPAGIGISGSDPYADTPDVAWSGSHYLVAWESQGKIRGARVTAAGEVLDSTPIAISNAPVGTSEPTVEWNGSNYLVAWKDYRPSQADVYGTRVAPDGTVLDPTGIAISTDPHGLDHLRLASDGDQWLAVWADYRASTSDVYGARVAADGSVLDPAGLPISTQGDHQYSPSIAWNGSNYLVAWEDWRPSNESDIYGTRVKQPGLFSTRMDSWSPTARTTSTPRLSGESTTGRSSCGRTSGTTGSSKSTARA